MLQIEKRLKANKLLPDLDLSYNFLTNQPEEWRGINAQDYKFGFTFKLPIFLRKERGDLQLVKLEVENSQYELLSASLEIQNKLRKVFNFVCNS